MWRHRLQVGALDPRGRSATNEDLAHSIRMKALLPDGLPLGDPAEHRPIADLGGWSQARSARTGQLSFRAPRTTPTSAPSPAASVLERGIVSRNPFGVGLT